MVSPIMAEYGEREPESDAWGVKSTYTPAKVCLLTPDSVEFEERERWSTAYKASSFTCLQNLRKPMVYWRPDKQHVHQTQLDLHTHERIHTHVSQLFSKCVHVCVHVWFCFCLQNLSKMWKSSQFPVILTVINSDQQASTAVKSQQNRAERWRYWPGAHLHGNNSN